MCFENWSYLTQQNECYYKYVWYGDPVSENEVKNKCCLSDSNISVISDILQNIEFIGVI